VLLFGFGMLNSMFYHGDILSIYAVLGLALIPVARLSSRWVLACDCFTAAAVCMDRGDSSLAGSGPGIG
jgi:uncharacterized membrane protein YeiB